MCVFVSLCSTHVYMFWFPVRVCVGCARGHSKPWAFLFFHILWGTRGTCKSWCVITDNLGPVPGSTLPVKHFTKNTLSRRARSTVVILFYLLRTESLSRLVWKHCGFYGNKYIWFASGAGGEWHTESSDFAHLRKLLHYDERRPTHLQIADKLIFSRGAAPVVCFHARLTENVE